MTRRRALPRARGPRRGPWRASPLAAVAAAAVLVLAGCAGVPTTSSPQIVRTLPVGDGGESAPATITPTANVAPRTLIEEFLQANALDASEHSSARAFLSPAARSEWTDTTVTVVADTAVGLPDVGAGGTSVLVRGRVLGTLDADGVYTPSLQAASAPARAFVYGVAKVDGQNRISSLRDGLLLTQSQFLSSFTARPVYFFDGAHQYLVPDPRWTSLTDPTQLSDWLMTQVADGPVSGLANAVDADTLPAQASARRISVTEGSSVAQIEIPGASQLSGGGRDRLAEQVANTLGDALRGRTMQITDGGRPVRIPIAGGTQFLSSSFTDQLGPPTPLPEVYFVRSGKLVDGQSGRSVSGAVNDGRYYLDSVAVRQPEVTTAPGTDRPVASATLTVAGIVTESGVGRLVFGTQNGGLQPTTVHGDLSRPAFAPGRSEVWVGDGTSLFAVAISGSRYSVTPVGLPPAAAGARIVALRLSPEGSRIAIVLRTASGEQQLYLGDIVRGGGQIRVDTLAQVSPEDVVVTDVAWAEPLKLIVIGDPTQSQGARVFDVGSDGSDWTERSLGNLPDPPTSLTVAAGQPAWVTASGSVWQQAGGSSWQNPEIPALSAGENPVYLE